MESQLDLVPPDLECAAHVRASNIAKQNPYCHLAVSVSVGCGGRSSENCTYFEAEGVGSGQCRAEICKLCSDICQIRLDFVTFAITGPSTSITAVGKVLHGVLSVPLAGADISYGGKCTTDVFTVSNAPNVPEICGAMVNEHGN